jgi:hypothetical protein
MLKLNSDDSQLTDDEQRIRMNIRDAYRTAQTHIIQTSIDWRKQRGYWFEVACLLELAQEKR